MSAPDGGSPQALSDRAVGVGLRVEIAADLLRDPSAADFVEVVAEACFASPSARREAIAVARLLPVVPHGVKLSLGSAEGIDRDRAKKLGALARELRAPVVTEHVAFVRAGGREIGHLTQVPLTREAVRVVARNVAEARRHLPDVPLLLENAAWTFRFPGDELDEPAFFHAIVEATGCDLLLDLGNLFANAVNAGKDPLVEIDRYPLDRVRMIHIAGGVTEDGFYFDTHAHPVPRSVFDLLDRFVARAGAVPVVLERDDRFPPFDELRDELRRARAILAAGARDHAPSRAASRAPAIEAPDDHTAAMASAQAAIAEALTQTDEPSREALGDHDPIAIARSRAVLRSKRVDDAIPILERLAPHRDALRSIAERCLAEAPRAPTLAGIADAIRVAEAASREPSLAGAAKMDLLLLRARFVGSAGDGSLRPRSGPFVGRERSSRGKVVWVIKGFGSEASVRVVEGR